MTKDLETLIEKLMMDKALAEQLGACKSEDEAYAFACTVQDGFTKEEFVEAMNAICQANNNGDISREDLANVAGGSNEDTWWTFTVTTYGAVFGSAAAI